MTDRELAAQADAHLRRTTVSYPEWVKRKAAGRYSPTDGSGTEWGKAFAALGKIGTAAPPPPSGDLLFDGRFDTGNFSRWPSTVMVDQGTVVDTPHGKMFRAKTDGGVSMLDMGGAGRFDPPLAYWLPWEMIPADVVHTFSILVPDGTDPRFPGRFITSPGSEWDMVWELHNRTDDAMGYPMDEVPGRGYTSTGLDIHDEPDGSIRFRLRVCGNTMSNPVETYHKVEPAIVRNRLYRFDVRIKHGQTATDGLAELSVDGAKVFSKACPTAYVGRDGKSGERLQYGIYRGHNSRVPGTTLYLGGLTVGGSRLG